MPQIEGESFLFEGFVGGLVGLDGIDSSERQEYWAD
jgi:hypothetical protein